VNLHQASETVARRATSKARTTNNWANILLENLIWKSKIQFKFS